jgi:phospholipid-translocating ATPase
VKLVERVGITIKSRTQTDITLMLPTAQEAKYSILNIFPFSSETKRMGIIVRNCVNNRITFYLKGADSVMRDLVLNKQKRGFIDEECRDLSMTGLRTLVISKKEMQEEQYCSWAKKYHEACNKLEVVAREMEGIMGELESGMEFLGITGIEDKLQDKLKSSI